jgi:hypothetical protein
MHTIADKYVNMIIQGMKDGRDKFLEKAFEILKTDGKNLPRTQNLGDQNADQTNIHEYNPCKSV